MAFDVFSAGPFQLLVGRAVAVTLLAVGFPVEVDVRVAQSKGELLQRLVFRVDLRLVAVSLVRVGGIIIDQTAPPEETLQVEMLGQLGLKQGPIATEAELAAGIDFVPQEAIDPKHGIPREPEPPRKDVDGLERVVKLVIDMLTPIEGLDPLAKTGLGIKQ